MCSNKIPSSENYALPLVNIFVPLALFVRFISIPLLIVIETDVSSIEFSIKNVESMHSSHAHTLTLKAINSECIFLCSS